MNAPFLPDSDSTRSVSSWTDRTPPHYRKHGWAKRGTPYSDEQPWPMTAKALLGVVIALVIWFWISR
jgi:hypothetical protein